MPRCAHNGDATQPRCDVLQQLQKLRVDCGLEQSEAGDVAARARMALRKAGSDEVPGLDPHHWCGPGLSMCGSDCEVRTCNKDIETLAHEIRRGGTCPFGISLRPANIEAHVAAVAPAQLLQRRAQAGEARLPVSVALGEAQQHTDPPHAFALLRARRERPRRRAAQQRDERTSLQSIELHPLPLAWLAA